MDMVVVMHMTLDTLFRCLPFAVPTFMTVEHAVAASAGVILLAA